MSTDKRFISEWWLAGTIARHEPTRSPQRNELDIWATLSEPDRVKAEFEHYQEVFPPIKSASVDGTFLSRGSRKRNRKAES